MDSRTLIRTYLKNENNLNDEEKKKKKRYET